MEISDHHLDAIICGLTDTYDKIRFGLHTLLSVSNFISPISLLTVISFLIENLKKFPQDRESTFKCLKNISFHNPHDVGAVVDNLVRANNFMLTNEPSTDDPCHLALIIIACNSCIKFPQIKCLLPKYFSFHIDFLITTFPEYSQPQNDSITCLEGSRAIDDTEIGFEKIFSYVFRKNEIRHFIFDSQPHVQDLTTFFENFSTFKDRRFQKFISRTLKLLNICSLIIEIKNYNSDSDFIEKTPIKTIFIKNIKHCFELIVLLESINQNVVDLLYNVNFY